MDILREDDNILHDLTEMDPLRGPSSRNERNTEGSLWRSVSAVNNIAICVHIRTAAVPRRLRSLLMPSAVKIATLGSGGDT